MLTLQQYAWIGIEVSLVNWVLIVFLFRVRWIHWPELEQRTRSVLTGVGFVILTGVLVGATLAGIDCWNYSCIGNPKIP